MKKTQLIVIIAVAAAVLAFILLAPEVKKAPGLIATVDLPAPDFELADLSGRPWKLSDLKGSVVVINFWATWCPPCRSEMPSLNNLNVRMMSEKNFAILTVLFKDKPENAADFMKEEKLSLNVLIDDKNVSGAKYGVSKVPETYIIDKKGVLRKKIIGPTEFDSPDAIAYIQTLLKE